MAEPMSFLPTGGREAGTFRTCMDRLRLVGGPFCAGSRQAFVARNLPGGEGERKP